MTERYSRQLLFDGIGRAGQQRLNAAKVVVAGCGALGSVGSELLVRAGVGRVKILDRDFVEKDNLHRQSLFTEKDAEECLPKAVAAGAALSAINSEVEVEAVVCDVTYQNVEQHCSGADVVIDGSDNFELRFLLNDFSVKYGIPWIYGAALGSYGVACAVVPGETPCLRCLMEEPPAPGAVETCESAGIIATIVHQVSSAQATLALKLLVGETLEPRVFQGDVWKGTWRSVPLPRGPFPDCPCCGCKRFDFLGGGERSLLTRLCGRDAVQVYPARRNRVDLEQIARRLSRNLDVQSSEYMIRARVNGLELAVFPDGRAIIKGTEDLTEARAIYSRFVGN